MVSKEEGDYLFGKTESIYVPSKLEEKFKSRSNFYRLYKLHNRTRGFSYLLSEYYSIKDHNEYSLGGLTEDLRDLNKLCRGREGFE